MSFAHPTTPVRERAVAGALSAALVGAIGWALVLGLGVGVTRAGEEALEAFDLLAPPPPPPERVVPPPKRSVRAEGRAAPPNIRSVATPVVAPAPVVLLPVPPILVTAPVARVGDEASSGASDRAGPGQGAGGSGDGFGGGGEGDGDGGGLGPETPPVPIRGRLNNSVLPDGLREVDGDYAVALRFFVETDGRVTGCRVDRTSGHSELDGNACRAIEKRFRYRPSLDGAGRPVRSVVVATQRWTVETGRRVPERR